MTTFLQWCGGLLLAMAFGHCEPVEHPADFKSASIHPPKERHLARYSSDPRDSAQMLLILRVDSTFVLQITPQKGQAMRAYSGKLNVAKSSYHLFFPDTVAHFNGLLTAVHTDASVVAYPDYSVVLDKKLRQLYVKGVLVSADTTGQP